MSEICLQLNLRGDTLDSFRVSSKQGSIQALPERHLYVDTTHHLQVCMHIHDLRIEAQKELLGNIFGNDVHGRMPIEEEHVVISTDETKLAELEKYFYENTDYGKQWAQFTKKNKI